MTIFDKLRAGWISASAEETEEIGRELARHLPENVALAVEGELGTGKTTLIRGIAKGLDIRANVTSPTYNIYTLYQGGRQLLHMDAYRLENTRELDNLTLNEFLKPPYLVAVEWPGHVPGFFEDFPTYWLRLEILPDHRHRIQLR